MMTDNQTLIALIALVVLAVSQFVTMISNVSGNIAHRGQMRDVRAMREAQAADIAEEQAFRAETRADLERCQRELDEAKRLLDAWVGTLKVD